MRTPSEQDLLTAWEQAAAEHSLDRALTLLRAACPERTRDELARLSVGTRDGLLLSLRERLFGAELRAAAECAACGESLELPTTTQQLRAAPALEDAPAGPPDERALEDRGALIRFRLVDTLDLAAVLACAAPAEAREVLRRRLVADAGAVTAEQWERVEARMAEEDPQADVSLELTCPGCGHGWQAPFDIASFVWAEIDRWARKLLLSVDALARAYGWREADVLALSPRRRQLYLELATA